MSPVSCGVYLLSLLLFLPSPGCLAQWRQIYIDPINGSNTANCLVSNSPHQPCRNLSYAIEHNHTTNWIEYVLSPGRHYFGINITFRGPLEGVAITRIGSGPENTLIQCSAQYAGFAFIGPGVSNIFLRMVTFHQCASLQNSTSRGFIANTSGIILSKTQVALYFYLCQNVSMSSVNVTESPNATGVVVYDTTGTNTIEDCYFIRNSVSGTSPYPGGGGFYLEFSYCKPGDNNCTDDEGPHIPSEFNSHSDYTFSHCSFSHNIADSLSKGASTYIIPYRTKHVAFGRGGGLSIYFNGNASGNTVTITDCTFHSNFALWGGGLAVEFRDTSAGNNVTMVGSLISKNHCVYKDSGGTAGGGMRIGQYVFEAGVQGYGGNTITLQGCTFTTNRGLNGGGLSISPVLQRTDPASVTIDDCYFEGNIARLGAAVHVSRFSSVHSGTLLSVQFSRCNFTNNSVAYSDQTNYQLGVGALYINAVPIRFRNTNSFTFNNASAIGVVATHLDFTNSTSFFESNDGHKGGAIALLGSAWLLINDFSQLFFYNNSAHVSGGAIYNKYIEQENLLTFRYNCFIRHENFFLAPYDWEAVFIFNSNTDSLHGGNSIHSTSILPCAWAGEGSETSHIFCWNDKWEFRNSCHYKVSCSEEISSDAGSITNTNQLPVQAIPGKLFHLPLEVRDDLGHDISDLTVFTASSGNMTVAMIESQFTYVAAETLQVRGMEKHTFPLQLDTAGDRVWHVEVQVELQMCPPGFVPSNTTANSTCECATHNYNGVVVCDQTAFNASLANGYWMGASPNQDGTLAIAQCPSGFCYTNPNSSFFSLPNSTDDLDARICGRVHRTGIMCGECENGYGPAVNSKTFECVLCNNTNIAANTAYYLLSVYLPLLVLFIVIIIFNIRLTTGPANSFILYSQLVSSTFDLNADGRIPLNLVTPHYDRLLKAYQLPYGIFNLNFFEQFVKPLCLGIQLNVLGVLELKYGVAVFPLLMIVIVVLFIKLKEFVSAKCFSRARTRSRAQSRSPGRWRMGNSLVHAFAAFLLLSYTKFSITSSYILGVEPLLDNKGNQIGTSRVYYGGQFASTNSTYILWYLLPSIIVLTIFVAIPPLLLLGYPVKLLEMGINKVDWLQRVYPADKVQILLDTFQGCYKNNMRFFAGVYFLFRLVSNVIYAVTDTYLEQFISQQIICAVIIAMLALCQPYRDEKKIFNYVDILIFTNLAVVNAFSAYLYVYSLSNPGQELPLSAFVVQYILVFLPLIYMLSYIIWYLTTPYHQQIKRTLWNLRIRSRGYQTLDNMARNTAIVVQDEDEIEAMLERAQHQNTYRPHPQPINGAVVEVHGPNGSSQDSGLHSQQSPSTGNYGSTDHIYDC